MRSKIFDDGSGCAYNADGEVVFHGNFKDALVCLSLAIEGHSEAEAEVERLEGENPAEIRRLRDRNRELHDRNERLNHELESEVYCVADGRDKAKAEVGRLEREAKRIVNAVLEISDAIEMEAYSIESSASAQAHDLASVRAKKDVIGRVLEAIST